VDKNRNGIFNEEDEPYIDPYPMNFEISYMPEPDPIDPVYPSAKVPVLPAGRFIRLILLVDGDIDYHYARVANTDTIDALTETFELQFEGVTNQEESGIWLPATPVDIFRTARQHLHTGVLRCEPLATDPNTGNQICPYPESEAITPPDLTPIEAEILF
jgi:hypothetical protein